MSPTAVADLPRTVPALRNSWPLLLGFAVLAVPSAISLGAHEWTRDFGAHEPIVLLAGAWLIWRQRAAVAELARPGRLLPTALAMAIALPTYVFGRAFDYPTLEAFGLWAAGVALTYACFGHRVLLRLWFPLLFMGLAIPPPRAFMDAATGPLKELVSALATSGLKSVGLPVARQGVIIFVAQYELLVEDACSGMNSLMGLTALSLLYGYLARGSSVANAIFMACLAIPVAIAANVVRVSLLVVITYLWGDDLAQSFLHYAAGIFLFLSALVIVFVIDQATHAVISRVRRS
jgi:exosortase